MATTEYPSIWTGSQIDVAIKAVRQNLEGFENLNANIARIDALEKSVGQESDEGSIANKVQNLEKTLWGTEVLNPSKSYNFLSVFGGTLRNNGQIIATRAGGGYNDAHSRAVLKFDTPSSGYNGYVPIYSFLTNNVDSQNSANKISCGLSYNSNSSAIEWRNQSADYLEADSYLSKLTDKGVFLGACWNDYAEFRKTDENCAGRVVCENGDGSLSRSVKRLQPGAEIVSDTYGFVIGETKECKTPIAVSGRVLAYPNEKRNSYKPGDPVCAGPNGTVSKMSRREVRKYPDRIIGTVSEIPDYNIWGKNEIEVNGRIWIRIK